MEEKGSKITRRLKQTGDLLLGGAKSQVSSYRSRFNNLVGAYDSFLSQLIEDYTSPEVRSDFVDSFFGKRVLSFAGIDGTVCKYDVFDLLVFFAGAYSSHGHVHVEEGGTLSVEYEEDFLERGVGVSSVLPIYINEVPLVDQTILTRSEDGSVDETVAHSDSWIVDNSAFADYLMTLSEFYLAYRLVSQEDPVDILLLDRVCSSEISSSYAETSDFRIDLEKECGLIGADVSGRPFTATDWVLSRRLFGNLQLGTPAARGEYLSPRIIIELMASSAGLSRNELASRLGLKTNDRMEKLDRELEAAMKGKRGGKGVVVRKGAHFSIRPEFRDLKTRLRTLVEQTCGRLFSEDSSVLFEHRFKIGDRWLTTNDLSFLALACLYLTVERCWANRTLLLGVAKDTSARDFKRQLIPVLNHTGLFKGGFSRKEGDTPDTDRMILQWISLHEREKLKTPWATLEYDTAFKTIVPHFDRKPGLVSGARRNQISLEKTFVKAYFQLCEAGSDSKLRSNVLLYDRLVYPEFDTDGGQVATLKHDYSGGSIDPEPVDVVLYSRLQNPIQEFVMRIFSAMTSMSVPDLFGHLKPLFVADKVAKYYFKQFRAMVESAGNWLVNRPELREFLFYLSSFRDRRSDVEQSRRDT
ncbi:MAG: hypothetical protein ACFFD9_10375 [Candidatus Thorarchaeota archaeon]